MLKTRVFLASVSIMFYPSLHPAEASSFPDSLLAFTPPLHDLITQQETIHAHHGQLIAHVGSATNATGALAGLLFTYWLFKKEPTKVWRTALEQYRTIKTTRSRLHTQDPTHGLGKRFITGGLIEIPAALGAAKAFLAPLATPLIGLAALAFAYHKVQNAFLDPYRHHMDKRMSEFEKKSAEQWQQQQALVTKMMENTRREVLGLRTNIVTIQGQVDNSIATIQQKLTKEAEERAHAHTQLQTFAATTGHQLDQLTQTVQAARETNTVLGEKVTQAQEIVGAMVTKASALQEALTIVHRVEGNLQRQLHYLDAENKAVQKTMSEIKNGKYAGTLQKNLAAAKITADTHWQQLQAAAKARQG